MNNYTCTKCGVVSTIGSNEPELKGVKCTCGTETVTLKRGVHKIEKPAPQNKVAAPTLPPPPAKAKSAPPSVFNPSAQSQIKSAPQGGSAPVVISTPKPVEAAPSPSMSSPEPSVELAPGTVIKTNPDGTADVVPVKEAK